MAETCKVGADAPNLNNFQTYEAYKNNVLLWRGITDYKPEKQGAMLAYAVPDESITFGNLIQTDLFNVHPVESLIGDAEGVDKVLDFLDGHIGKETRIDELEAFEKIFNYRRRQGQTILDYLKEHERYYNKCKQSGITFTDTCSAFIVAVAAKLDHTQATLVKAVIDIEKEAGKGTMYAAVKRKIKEMLSDSLGNICSGEPEKSSVDAFLADHQEAFATWQKNNSYKKNYTNNYNNNNNYNARKSSSNGTHNGARNVPNNRDAGVNQINPATGKPLKCKYCGSYRHFQRDCPDYKKAQNSGNSGNNTQNSANSTNRKKGKVFLIQTQNSDEEDALLSQFENIIPEPEDDNDDNQPDQLEKVLFTTNKEELSRFTAESINCAALDSCCTASVAGKKWMDIFLSSVPGELRKQIKGPYKSRKTFQFGNQGILPTMQAYTIPIIVAGERHLIEVDVINSDIPLLMSKTHMKQLGITLNMADDTATVNGKPIRVDTTSAGHFILNLFGDNEHQDTMLMQEIYSVNMLKENEESQLKLLQKLHKQFGHRPKKVFVNLLKSAEQWDPKFSAMIDKIIDGCEGCILRKRNPDKPAVSLPMAKDFNHILTMDLKKWDDKHYVLYFVDMFTRYTVGSVITNKKPETIVAKLFSDWIRYFTAPDIILTDNGGEFVNEAIKEACAMLNIYHATTAAYSPWQNGHQEKNHYTTDNVGQCLERDYPEMPLEQVIAWACAVKNSLTNVYGYNAFELTFGRAPRLPSIMTDPIPASQVEPTSRALIENIKAIHGTRAAFAKAEKCEKLKLALRLKMRAVNRDYKQGELVYYKREKDDKWLGPAKVIFQDGKVIGIRTSSSYVRVSANRLWPAGQTLSERLKDEEEQFEKIKRGETLEEKSKVVEDRKPFKMDESSDEEPEAFQEAREEANEEQEQEEEANEDPDRTEITNSEGTTPTNANEQVQPLASPEKFKPNQRIELKENGKWERGVVLGQAGKKVGKYKHWYNVQLDSGKQFSADFARQEVRREIQSTAEEQEEVYDIRLDNGKETTAEANENLVKLDEEQILATWVHEEVLAVMMPREMKDSPECLAAKEVELQKLKDFDTYQEVKDDGQSRITTTWVLTMKGKEVKARLTARGFQEEDEHPKESPTMQKYSLRILLTIASAKGWTIETVDVKSAFLQGTRLERKVYVKPPKEANVIDVLWLLNKCLYGLRDASRQWYTRVEDVLTKLGFEKCTYDSGLFFLMKDDELEALVGLHVDDFLNAGGEYFHNTILPQILNTFMVGKSERGSFMYTGFQLNQDKNGVTLDQSDYVEGISIPVLDPQRMKQTKADMTFEELSLLRKMTGQLNWTVRSTRPDLSFNMIACSTHFKGGTVADLKYAKTSLVNLKKNEAVLRFSNMGDISKSEIWLFTDASYGNLNGGTDSTQGYVLFLVRPEDGRCAPIDWRANKIDRVVTSTLAAEAISLTKGLDAAIAFKWTLEQLLGKEGAIPVRAIIDNKDTFESVHSTTDVQERKLRREIGVIKQMLKAKELQQLIWLEGKYQIADPLTKLGANSNNLVESMQSGKIPREIFDAVKRL